MAVLLLAEIAPRHVVVLEPRPPAPALLPLWPFALRPYHLVLAAVGALLHRLHLGLLRPPLLHPAPGGQEEEAAGRGQGQGGGGGGTAAAAARGQGHQLGRHHQDQAKCSPPASEEGEILEKGSKHSVCLEFCLLDLVYLLKQHSRSVYCI